MKENIVVLVFTDGRREYFPTMFFSFIHNVTAKNIISKIIIDDSANVAYANWLDVNYKKEVDHIIHHKKRLGFGGTIRDTWLKLEKTIKNYDFVFHLEDDFVFMRKINLDNLVKILKKNPKMAQVALLRQPWNESEAKAGGTWQQFPDRFIEKFIKDNKGREIYYLQHKEWFTTNPSLYPKWVVNLGWPKGPDSEERFWTEKLLPNNNQTNCAYFDKKSEPPAIHHIGINRIGIEY